MWKRLEAALASYRRGLEIAETLAAADPDNAGLSFPTMRFFRDQWAVFRNPSVERGMVNMDAVLGHNSLKISIGYRVANIEKHGTQDHVFWEVSAFETDHGIDANLLGKLARPNIKFV